MGHVTRPRPLGVSLSSQG